MAEIQCIKCAATTIREDGLCDKCSSFVIASGYGSSHTRIRRFSTVTAQASPGPRFVDRDGVITPLVRPTVE